MRTFINPSADELPDDLDAAPMRPATQPNKAKFPLLSFADLRTGNEIIYLVKGLVPRIGLTVVWGPPKCGKSFWAFDLAMHVALGWDYRGRRVNAGPVVYCAFEGAEGLKRRAEAFRLRFLPEESEPVPFYLSPSPMDLVNDHTSLIGSIRAHLPDTGAALVVLDTLNRSLRGSESDDRDMTAYIKAADAIRDAFDCAVVVVHHCGVDATRPRGHTSLAGAVDAQLAIKRDTADNVIVTVERMKDGPEGDVIASALESVEIGLDDDGDPISSCVVVPSEAVPQAKHTSRTMSPRTRLAMEALDEVILANGQPAPPSLGLPDGVKIVKRDDWKAEILAREIIPPDDKNPRVTFNRIFSQLADRHAIGRRDGMVWKASA